MEKIKNISSSAVPLPVENIDTDQIIPARFLKATGREGFGKNLFCDWRYGQDGKPKESFVLNNPIYTGSILVAGKNFGSGSSREHAAWALYDYGFRVVISSFFADIFRNNALNNGLLPIQVSDSFLQAVFTRVEKDPASVISVDLEKQSVKIESLQLQENFDINPLKKRCLLEGLSELDILLGFKPAIEEYENKSIIHSLTKTVIL